MEPTIKLSVSQGPEAPPSELVMETFGGLGSRVEYGMVMTTGGSPVNYLGPTTNLDPAERLRLAPVPDKVPEPQLGWLSKWHGGWHSR